MTIAFSQIPATRRSPFAYIEVNASPLNVNSAARQKILVIGQRTSAGTVAANVPTLITSYAQAVSAFGQGSVLANMFEALFKNNSTTEKWGIAVDDDSGGTAATGSIAITGPATAAGKLSLYLGGVLISVPVATNDTATEIGDAIEAAINANLDLPVTADNTTGTVTLTFRHKGVIGNYYTIASNFYGANSGEVLPAGVGVTLTQLSSGAGDPALTNTLAAIPDDVFNYWVFPYQGATPIESIQSDLEDRWGPLRMLEGFGLTAAAGSVGTLTTLGEANNSEHISIVDAGLNSPTPSYVWAAAAMGAVADSASVDPSRPLSGLKLKGVIPSPIADRRNADDKEDLLYSGIATTTVEGGDVYIDRLITTYQTNASGVEDATFLDATTVLTVAMCRQDLRGRVNVKFRRMKIADDGSNFTAGQYVVTPSTIKGEMVAWYLQLEKAGIVQNVDEFIRNLNVERNANDPTRVDVALTLFLTSPLYVMAINLSFAL